MNALLVSFFAGLAVSASLIAAIGAQNMFVLRQGLRREHVGMIVVFCAVSDAILIIAGVSGVGAFLSALPQFTRALSLIGAAFLAWYGIKSFRRATTHGAMHATNAEPVSPRRALAAVAAFTWLNPHVYLDTVLLMGTAAAAQPAPLRPLFSAGASCTSVMWFSALGYGARLLGPIFARPRAWQILDVVIGCVMFGLAATLVW